VRQPTGPWTAAERRRIATLRSPGEIQAFLDAIPYSADPFYRSPRRVLADRKAHCFDGALFAAAMLRRIGDPPLLVDTRAVRDDDHVIAIFRRHGCIGAVAKSNFVGLRFREPVFRSVRELVLSYFEAYYNAAGEKTLRSFSAPLDLRRFNDLQWETSDAHLGVIATRLDTIRHYPLLSRRTAGGLIKVDERSLKAGMLGLDRSGLYKVRN
jgi:hypothetical protein